MMTDTEREFASKGIQVGGVFMMPPAVAIDFGKHCQPVCLRASLLFILDSTTSFGVWTSASAVEKIVPLSVLIRIQEKHKRSLRTLKLS